MKLRILCLTMVSVLIPAITHASVIEFSFTGRLTVADFSGMILSDTPEQPYIPISAMLTYDTVSGIGSSNLTLTINSPYFGIYPTFHDINMIHLAGTNTITGQMLLDFGTTNNSPVHIEWDATGFFNAINYGLQPGDVLSGSTLYHDANGNGVQDAGEYLTDIGSALPYSDTLLQNSRYLGVPQQGPAPLAATSNTLGPGADTPFYGFIEYVDIGSGNSMHVLSVSAVPVPAAFWLFGSGVLALFGIMRTKRQ